LKPESELVSADEFGVFAVTRDVESKPTEIEKNRQIGLQKATYGLQSDLMSRIEGFNPRWVELKKIVGRIDDAAADVRDKLFNAMFGLKSWEYELTFEQVFNKMKSPNWEQTPPQVQEFFAELVASKKKIVEFQMLVNAVNALASSFQKQIIEQEFDRPYDTLRLGDIVKYVEEHQVKAE
jgi:hypothetical protein